MALHIRALIRVARADTSGAEADSRRLVKISAQAADPQARLPALANRVGVLVQSGRADEAAPLAEELFALASRVQLPFPGGIEATFPACLVGVDRWLAAISVASSWRTPWLEAIDQLLRGDAERAAALYAAMPSPKDEAFARLEAAKTHAASGRIADARAQAEAALACYRRVGAVPYAAEAEALLAASAA